MESCNGRNFSRELESFLAPDLDFKHHFTYPSNLVNASYAEIYSGIAGRLGPPIGRSLRLAEKTKESLPVCLF